ncbi:MAG: helix-turn-helix domain-containing protein [Alloprevotella sp.]
MRRFSLFQRQVTVGALQVVFASHLFRASPFDVFFPSSFPFLFRREVWKEHLGKKSKNCSIFPTLFFSLASKIFLFLFVFVMKERIRSVMDYAKMSQQDFASALGISPASLSSIFTGRTNPTGNHVTAIHRAFPEINVNWLMFGEGEMMTKSPEGESTETSQSNEADLTPSAQPLSLFPEERVSGHEMRGQQPQKTMEMSRENSYDSRSRAYAHQNVKNFDKPTRKIREIRVFFDDGTYESFVPSSK